MIKIYRESIGYSESISIYIEGPREAKNIVYRSDRYVCSLTKLNGEYLVDLAERMKTSKSYTCVDDLEDMMVELQRFIELVALKETDPIKAGVINAQVLLAMASLND